MELRQQTDLLAAITAALEKLTPLQQQLTATQAETDLAGSPLREVAALQTALNQLQARIAAAQAAAAKAQADAVAAAKAQADAAARQPAPAAVVAEAVQVAAPRSMFGADTVFATTKLSENKRKWHTHLRNALPLANIEPNARRIAATSTSELVGFSIKDYAVAMVVALDASGDPAFLHELLGVMDVLKNRQGFVIDSNKDLAFISSLYALVAYVCHINRATDPVFAAAATYWRERTLDLCKTGIPLDDLTHSFAASVETAWYLYLLTGEDRYKVEAEKRRADLVASITIGADQRAVWNHRPAFAANKSANTIQRTTYGRYVVQTCVMLKRTGLDTVPMESLVKAALLMIRPNSTISYYVDGTQDGDLSKITLSNWALLVPFDPSGELAKRLNAVVKPNHVIIPAGFLAVG